MPNSSDTGNLIHVVQIYSTYSTHIIFGLGFIGNLLNILVFTNLKIFRHNRCAFYLIVESFVGIAQLTHSFINEIWKTSINGIEPVDVSLVWYKLKTTWLQSYQLMLAFIVYFSAIDQFLSSNHRLYLQQLGSFKLARTQISFANLVCLLHIISFVLFLKIHPLFGCRINNIGLIDYCSIFFYPVLNSLLPIFVSSMFSILVYRNVPHLVRRQISIDRRKLDQQLTAMIFVRVITYVILSLPYAVYEIYSVNVPINEKDQYRYGLNQLVHLIVVSLIYVNPAVIFPFG